MAPISCGAATSGVAEGGGLVTVADADDLVGDDVLGHGARKVARLKERRPEYWICLLLNWFDSHYSDQSRATIK